MDSTLVLYQTARDKRELNETVNAITVINDGMGMHEQQMAEKRARAILKKKLPNNIRYFTVEIKSSMASHNYQLPIWLSSICMYIQNGDNVNFGYLSSDGADFWAKKPEMEQAFYATMRLYDRTKATISFPLQYWTKGEVIRDLKKLKLLKYTWTCGDPKKGKACGKCMKCISLKRWSKFPSKGKIT